MTTTTSKLPLETSARSLGMNLPQRMGSRLWAPMFAMALMGFAVGIILAFVRGAERASSSPDPETLAQLGHLVPAFMFLGFMAVFTAISFAIARILGEFRSGGGNVQEATGNQVHTLKMPTTVKIFMAGMMMAMMVLLITVILHIVQAVGVDADVASLEDAEQWAIVLEGIRRAAVAVFLFSIAFGLASITTVINFQTRRIQELPGGDASA